MTWAEMNDQGPNVRFGKSSYRLSYVYSNKRDWNSMEVSERTKWYESMYKP